MWSCRAGAYARCAEAGRGGFAEASSCRRDSISLAANYDPRLAGSAAMAVATTPGRAASTMSTARPSRRPEHAMATRLYPDTRQVHFNHTARSTAASAPPHLGGHVISLARAVTSRLGNSFRTPLRNAASCLYRACSGPQRATRLYAWSEFAPRPSSPRRDVGASASAHGSPEAPPAGRFSSDKTVDATIPRGARPRHWALSCRAEQQPQARERSRPGDEHGEREERLSASCGTHGRSHTPSTMRGSGPAASNSAAPQVYAALQEVWLCRDWLRWEAGSPGRCHCRKPPFFADATSSGTI